MRVVALYHPKSDHGGRVEDYVAEYKRFRDFEIDLVSLETTEGAEMASLYDVNQYPSILAIANDGSLQKAWQSEPLPAMNEIDAYVAQARS